MRTVSLQDIDGKEQFNKNIYKKIPSRYNSMVEDKQNLKYEISRPSEKQMSNQPNKTNKSEFTETNNSRTDSINLNNLKVLTDCASKLSDCNSAHNLEQPRTKKAKFLSNEESVPTVSDKSSQELNQGSLCEEGTKGFSNKDNEEKKCKNDNNDNCDEVTGEGEFIDTEFVCVIRTSNVLLTENKLRSELLEQELEKRSQSQSEIRVNKNFPFHKGYSSDSIEGNTSSDKSSKKLPKQLSDTSSD